MRTKKTAIKNAIITRTIPMTTVKFLCYDMETKEVKEEMYHFILEYNENEAEQALRELGYKVVDVLNIDKWECKRAMDMDKFFQYSRQI